MMKPFASCGGLASVRRTMSPLGMIAAASLSLATGCNRGPMQEEQAAPSAKRDQAKAEGFGDIGALSVVGGGDSARARGGLGGGAGLGGLAREQDAEPAAPPAAPADGKGGDPARPATRSYFPETFLFDPRVETDASGQAVVSTRVPDRLTTWQILALAHARNGAQGGAVASFLGTLPAYVEVLVPERLFVGDEVLLPIEVTNTTDQVLERALTVAADGAGRATLTTRVRVGARSSAFSSMVVRVDRLGSLVVRASLAGDDSVERTVSVVSNKRPIQLRVGGRVDSVVQAQWTLPEDADPSTVTLLAEIFPGRLGILRSELGLSWAGAPGISAARSIHVADAARDAYSLLLAGEAQGLFSNIGASLDMNALRASALVAQQRALRHLRQPTADMAAHFLVPLLSNRRNPVMERMFTRALESLRRAQRPDGTFSGETGWSAQRLLVMTAEGCRAANEALRIMSSTSTQSTRQGRAADERVAMDLRRMVLLAEGVIERSHKQVEDGYTAALWLTSGAVPASIAASMRQLVVDAVVREETRAVAQPPRGVVRADGTTPTSAEFTALAILALHADATSREMVDALGNGLLALYAPGVGFGDGVGSLAGWRALTKLFPGPPPKTLQAKLSIADAVVAEQTFSDAIERPMQLRVPLPGLRGVVRASLAVDPALAGLAYAMTFSSAVPWTVAPTNGLELAIRLPEKMQVEAPIKIAVESQAASQSGHRWSLDLPAGVRIDPASLQSLEGSGTILRAVQSEGRLDVDVPALQPGQSFRAELVAFARFSGRLQSGPGRIHQGDTESWSRPVTWNVAK